MSGSAYFDKAYLRRKSLDQKRGLDLEAQHQLVAAMLGQLEALRLPNARLGFSYKALAKNHEVDAVFFEDWVEQQCPDIRWAYPRTEIANMSMVAILDDDDAAWRTSKMGIAEPASGNIVPPDTLDIVLVPLLAFDSRGFRVGYGKGFYDRFLSQCKPGIVTIGLSWFEPVPFIADIHANDVPLKYCVTPYHLYAF